MLPEADKRVRGRRPGASRFPETREVHATECTSLFVKARKQASH